MLAESVKKNDPIFLNKMKKVMSINPLERITHPVSFYRKLLIFAKTRFTNSFKKTTVLFQQVSVQLSLLVKIEIFLSCVDQLRLSHKRFSRCTLMFSLIF